MDIHLSDGQTLLKNGQKSDSFADHFEQHFKSTTSLMDLRKCITFKVVKDLKIIGAMKSFTKPSCNLFMEECLTILENLRHKRVTFMKKGSNISGASWHKTNFHQFFLSNNDHINV